LEIGISGGGGAIAMMGLRIKSGAKDTRTPDASRIPLSTVNREASRAGRVHRRFWLQIQLVAKIFLRLHVPRAAIGQIPTIPFRARFDFVFAGFELNIFPDKHCVVVVGLFAV
jgi:hypothetical protein